MFKPLAPALATLALALAAPASAASVRHELGTTEIQGIPKRVVALEYSFVDALAQLGVKPAGIAQDAVQPPHLGRYLAGVKTVGSRAQPSLEAILALKPDLIVADLQRHKAIYPQLSRIAPTLVYNSLRGSYEDLIAQFEQIATVVGRAGKGRVLLQDHRRTFEKARLITSRKAGPVLAGVLSPGRFTAHSSESFVGSLLERLGRQAAAQPRDGESQYEMSLEGIVALNPAAIVLMRSPGEGTPLDEWRSSPLWRSLAAVKAGRVYEFDRELWSKGRGLIALNAILGDAVASGLLRDTPAASPERPAP